MTRFELDAGCTFGDSGRMLIGGSPLTMFRLTKGGVRVVEQIQSGADLAPGHERLTDRLLELGAIHPVPLEEGAPTTADVTLVIPAYNADPAAVRRIVCATNAASALIIDDASPTPFPNIECERADGTPIPTQVIRLVHNGGPGFARQEGVRLVTTPFVAFVDTDVSVTEGWLERLLAHFTTERTALVAPRVCAATHELRSGMGDRLQRFEAVRNPLDLGAVRARIRAGTRVSYVPAAALVVRTDAIRAIGGFSPGMRLGEDVDLVWRLDEAGWTCRYEPGVVVHHTVRSDLGAWVRQRMGYGESATDLAARHPGAVPPAQASAWSAVSWALPAIGAPLLGAAVAVGSTVALISKLPESADRPKQALRLAGLGHLHAGRIFAAAITRSWWPIALLLALVSRRARRVLACAVLIPTVADWWKVRHEIDPLTFAWLRLLDDGAYGAGLWRGAWARRSAAALLPDLTSWPRRNRYARSRPGAAPNSGATQRADDGVQQG